MYIVEIGTGIDFKCQLNAVSAMSKISKYGEEIKMGIMIIPMIIPI